MKILILVNTVAYISWEWRLTKLRVTYQVWEALILLNLKTWNLVGCLYWRRSWFYWKKKAFKFKFKFNIQVQLRSKVGNRSHLSLTWICQKVKISSQIARFMGPTWGPPGSCWPQMGPILAPWTLLSGVVSTFLPLALFYWGS